MKEYRRARPLSNIRIFSDLATLESDCSGSRSGLRSSRDISSGLRVHATSRCIAVVKVLPAHSVRFGTRTPLAATASRPGRAGEEIPAEEEHKGSRCR